MRNISIPALLLPLLLFIACNRDNDPVDTDQGINETRMLLNYFSQNGNLVNDPDIPSMIFQKEVYDKLLGHNQLIIDLRSGEAFNNGHIAHSVNISPSNILNYFEHTIDPNAFENIVLVCNNAMLSGYVTAVLQFLGYKNVVTMRNGLSSWNMEIAEQYWLAAMSSHMEGKLETLPHPKNNPGELPVLKTGKTTAYEILRARALEILNINMNSLEVTADAVLEQPSNYYMINYWPDSLYRQGHITGSIQYQPKASLGKDQYLNTLPTDKSIVVYCFTGQHSVYPLAYLRLLGYDAYHIPYGTNAFIHHTILNTQPQRRSFTPEMVKNYPLVGPNEQAVEIKPNAEIQTDSISVQGGC